MIFSPKFIFFKIGSVDTVYVFCPRYVFSVKNVKIILFFQTFEKTIQPSSEILNVTISQKLIIKSSEKYKI